MFTRVTSPTPHQQSVPPGKPWPPPLTKSIPLLVKLHWIEQEVLHWIEHWIVNELNINWTLNIESSLVLYMVINKERNLRLTNYKIEIVYTGWHARYCARWALRVILGIQFFSVPKKHISSNHDPEFLGVWS